MKNFILKYIWPIRIVWVIGTICIFVFVHPKLEYAIPATMLMGVNFLILGTFVWFPEKIIGKRKSSTETEAGQKPDSVDVNETVAHKEKNSFPEPSAVDVATRKNVFDAVQQARDKCTADIEAAKKTRDEALLATMNPFMLQLKVRVPEHLREKVNNVFMFTQADMDTHHKHDLQKIFLERMGSVFGMYILNKLFLTEHELNELNQAWHPFVFIHPTMHYIVVLKSETAREKSNAIMQELRDAQKELTT